jgi:hypothetical protein
LGAELGDARIGMLVVLVGKLLGQLGVGLLMPGRPPGFGTLVKWARMA